MVIRVAQVAQTDKDVDNNNNFAFISLQLPQVIQLNTFYIFYLFVKNFQIKKKNFVYTIYKKCVWQLDAINIVYI